MLRLGLIGTNTSHSGVFAQIFNGSAQRAPGLEGGKIVTIWGNTSPEGQESQDRRKLPDARALAETHGIDTIVDDPAQMIGQIDIALVVDDTGLGAYHGRLARPFIDAGIPTFMDKPMTLDLEEAIELFDLAEQRGSPLTSSSALRYAREIADFQEQLPALGTLSSIVSVGPGDWFNYGVHAVEMYQTIVGTGASWVQRFPGEQRDIVLVGYDDGPTVVVETLRDAAYVFHMVAYGSSGWAQCEVKDSTAFYTRMMGAVLEMGRSGKAPLSRTQTLEVLAVLHAGERSAETGHRVAIADILGTAYMLAGSRKIPS